MFIKNAGTLSQKYFCSYFKLTMNTQHCTVEEAKDIIFNRFFEGNVNKLGKKSFQNFKAAYDQMKADKWSS